MLSPSESPIRAEGLFERELAQLEAQPALHEYVLPAPAPSPAAAGALVRPAAG